MRSRALALLGGLFLLLPAGAIAQSAGDKQYTDPFAGESPSHKSPPSSSSPSGSTGNSNAPALRSPGQLAQNSAQTGSDPTATGSTSSGGPLPRTGLEAWMLVLMGGLMLLGGVLLRLGLRPLRSRAAGAEPGTLGRDVRLTRPAGR